MLDIIGLAKDLQSRVEWQETPRPVELNELAQYIVHGHKMFLTYTGRASEFSDEKYICESGTTKYYDAIYGIDETEYIVLNAHIMYLEKVQSSVSNLRGYTTDAMSVTHADKPYANIENTLRELKYKRAIIHMKLMSSW